MRRRWVVAACVTGWLGALAAAGCSLITKFETTDASSSSSSSAAGCSSTALICEGFENGFRAMDAGGGWSNISEIGGTASIETDPAHVHWGAQSLRLETDPNDGAADGGIQTFVAWQRTDASVPATIYVRAWL